MFTKALSTLAALAATSGEPHVQVETVWGFHYLIAADEAGNRSEILARCKLDGTGVQLAGEFALPSDEGQRFEPTIQELLRAK